MLSYLPLCRSPRALLSPSRIQALAKGVWCVPARSTSPLEEGISLREGEGCADTSERAHDIKRNEAPPQATTRTDREDVTLSYRNQAQKAPQSALPPT